MLSNWTSLKLCRLVRLNSLPEDKLLVLYKMKVLAKMVQLFFDLVANIAGKGENSGYQHFLPFPQCFQKTYFPGLSSMCGRGIIHIAANIDQTL